ncbi:hypothetical protein [Hymenobacter arizonensis]|uniref:Uncharacterized protein n=1 Tax=Hymenobacter arizonensis TaxID=1227077 RepID=A0A1I6BMS5_HYMAR|nr:hypothetical protein [Hymenobacter arizonensis]SFQ82248.1 hypothetical protein SAMN04515668_4771 [Hymenobacter arizonensis]
MIRLVSLLPPQLGRWVLLAGLGASLAGCPLPPPRHLSWEVCNRTADTLRVTTRYALDSTVLTPDEAQQFEPDPWFGPLHRLVRHGTTWYLVHDQAYTGIVVAVDYPTKDTVQLARVVAVRGRVTYALAPGQTQQLAHSGYASRDWAAERRRPLPFAELLVQQGRFRRRLSASDFRPQTDDPEVYRVRATVGPGRPPAP